MRKRPLSFYFLAVFFGLFVLFLYGPMFAIFILSLQGPDGALTFPVRSFGFHWIASLFFQQQRIGDFGAAFQRSLLLGFIVMAVTVVVALMAGLAFRQKFKGSSFIFYLTISSLIVPSVLISLGIGIAFNLIGVQTNWYSSALGGHLTWTLPFAFLIMLGVFNRFNLSYEEAARDLGASEFQAFQHIILPLIAPALIGVALFGFTLSYDEFTRTSLISGARNTLPLEIFGMTTNVTSPALYALGTVTTVFSFSIIAIAFLAYGFFAKRQQP
ncbi:ABC transporter permease [Oculatella sp. LEGE 06141]|uniref:ABC transporter permease n=1 Tax=Oculatella sp. LEGE 06141 TaxID=1828648 RepID=UPI00187FB0F7|nr:ABC transporter permease [Oculatella sp. LEGE 06141]MBE9182160.1 ABC transporter permease [Oculatella sp. LEGE 06141]